MGNIGFSQGLAEIIREFEREPELNPNVRLVITGNGAAAPEAAREVRTARVEMLGLVASDLLERELHDATLALVSQKHGGEEFNIPSKLMNFMMYGLPMVASVDPGSEVARIVRTSGGGWVVDNGESAPVRPDAAGNRGLRARRSSVVQLPPASTRHGTSTSTRSPHVSMQRFAASRRALTDCHVTPTSS